MMQTAFSLTAAGTNFSGVVGYVLGLINDLIPLVWMSAFLVFFWGLSKFILASGDPKEVEKGKQYILWGIVALFVLVTYNGIIYLAGQDLEIGTSGDGGSLLAPTFIQ